MKNLLDYNYCEIKQIVSDLKLPSFRAEQLFQWLNNGADYSEMSNLPKDFKNVLSEEYCAQPLSILEKLCSQDGSIKYLYKLQDGNIIEGVFMPHDYGNTICVSTQVGCRMGCNFCASGIGGLVRNLSSGEILSQIIQVNRDLGGNIKDRKISNVVLMGSGEPLDNYDNVTKFISCLIDEKGLNIGQRSISLSTCGLANKIKQLADDGFSVTLSISLHSTCDEDRQKLMPIAKKFNLNVLLKCVKYYFEKTGRRIVFEYSLVPNVNMSDEDIKRLYDITKGYPSHVNLIMLNYVEEKNIKGCTISQANDFLRKLEKAGISATIRKSMGSDIGGACGQLRRKHLKS